MGGYPRARRGPAGRSLAQPARGASASTAEGASTTIAGVERPHVPPMRPQGRDEDTREVRGVMRVHSLQAALAMGLERFPF